MDANKLQEPVTEIELAEFMHCEEMLPAGRDILRRLAFERTSLKTSISELVKLVEELQESYREGWIPSEKGDDAVAALLTFDLSKLRS